MAALKIDLMIKIPYSISNFAKMSLNGLHYIDRTPYIEALEARTDATVLYVRPRRFGKSLFLSMLHHYYGREYQSKFQALFGKYYIGQNPSPLANQYLVLKLDFSSINTHDPKQTKIDFLAIVREASLNFIATYSKYFDKKDIEEIKAFDTPNNLIRSLINKVGRNAPEEKIYILIDEYDHFANELLAFDFGHFKRIVGHNGWVRKFYEVLKTATTQGIVDKMFITGIAPITLDNLTTGFNIATNFTTDPMLHEMMGFTELEVIDILKEIGIPEGALDNVLINLKLWYDGYLFSEVKRDTVYNPDMVLYFAKYYAQYQRYPKDLLDENIASDYGKMRKMFQINDSETANRKVLKKILEHGYITEKLVKRYSFDLPWTQKDFISLLFYMGILTIHGQDLDEYVFKMPNFVIQQLYYQFFHQITLETVGLHPNTIDLTNKVKALAQYNDIQPLMTLTQNIISQLAIEDKAHFNEVSLKTLFASFLFQVGYFNIFSELQVRKSSTEKGKVDLLLTRRPPFKPKYQFVFELKYIQEKQRASFEKIKADAVVQLQKYVRNDDNLKNLDNLKAYLIIFIGHEGRVFAV